MASKHPACDAAHAPRAADAAARPDPEVARRLRAVFPDVWARYEWLLAARMPRPRRTRTTS